MTGSKVFPKIDGDILYASDINAIYFKELKQKIEDLRTNPTNYIELKDDGVIAVGQEFSDNGLDSKFFFGNNQTWPVTTTSTWKTNTAYRKSIPCTGSNSIGSLFTSRYLSTPLAYNYIIPYVDFEVLTSYDELDDNSIDDTKWSASVAPGSVIETGVGLTITLNGSVFTSGTIPTTVDKLYFPYYLLYDDDSVAASNVKIMLTNDTGSILVVHGAGRTGQSTTWTEYGNLRARFDKGQSGIQLIALSDSNDVSKPDEIVNMESYVDLGSINSSPMRLQLQEKDGAGGVQGGMSIGYLRWRDLAANYVSTGSIQVTNNGGATWNYCGNGETFGFTEAGSNFGVRAIYKVPTGGSEIIQQNGWGFKVY